MTGATMVVPTVAVSLFSGGGAPPAAVVPPPDTREDMDMAASVARLHGDDDDVLGEWIEID